jgi:hypothetical protein
LGLGGACYLADTSRGSLGVTHEKACQRLLVHAPSFILGGLVAQQYRIGKSRLSPPLSSAIPARVTDFTEETHLIAGGPLRCLSETTNDATLANWTRMQETAKVGQGSNLDLGT